MQARDDLLFPFPARLLYAVKMPPIGKAVEALKSLYEIPVRFETCRIERKAKIDV